MNAIISVFERSVDQETQNSVYNNVVFSSKYIFMKIKGKNTDMSEYFY